MVAVLIGCSVPVVLRRVIGGVEGVYEVVGECFMPGYMNGEVFDQDREVEKLVLV